MLKRAALTTSSNPAPTQHGTAIGSGQVDTDRLEAFIPTIIHDMEG